MDTTAALSALGADQSRELLLGRAADEFFAAAARGERPSLSDYAERYPQIAADIRQVFPALALVADSISGHAASNLVIQGDAPQQLGDYRLIREIGRGGMGVVFEAEQLSIARRVALKILPFASLATDNALKRFQNEIRTAASLEHPHIISIFASGEERGVHFFAMQLIRGCSLADAIGGLRGEPKPEEARPANEPPRPVSPEEADAETSPIAELSTVRTGNKAAFFRRVAELGIQACEALHYAHSMGVVHRDVKPSNLMIDASGRVWLTDFGLALGHADAGLTMTGDLVGTLRYMSPEQTLGHGVVDQRTDVYSLGATLYELATLRPAFDAPDRGQLLQAIAAVDPPAPRQVDRDIPADLDTIISKATEKDPRDRYASAKDLGDDLRRMLAHEPTRARRASLGNRMVKWSRRHVAVVWAAAAVLLLSTIVLTIASLQVAKWYRLADRRRAEAEHQRQVARARLEESQKQEQTAKAVSDFLLEMLTSANPERAKGPEYTVRQLLDDFSTGLTNRLTDQPEVKATVHNTIGNAYRTLGVYDRSRFHIEAALDLSRSDPDFDVSHVADLLVDNALRLYEQKPRAPYDEIIAPVRKALDIYRREGSPPERLLSAYNVLLMALASQARIETGRFEEPAAVAEEALALAEASDALDTPVVAAILHTLAHVQCDQGKYDLAEATAQRSVALHRQLDGDHHPATAWGLCMLGHSLRAQEKYADAESAYREALAIFQRHFTPQHSAISYAMENLASVTAESGDRAAKDSLLESERPSD